MEPGAGVGDCAEVATVKRRRMATKATNLIDILLESKRFDRAFRTRLKLD